MILRAIHLLQFQSFEDSGCLADGIPTLKCFEVVFNNILFLAAGAVILILFFMIMRGGFQYLTSRGDAEAMKSARNTIFYAVIGLVLFMSSYLIITVIQYLFIGDPDEGAPNLLKFEIPEFEPGGSSFNGPDDGANPDGSNPDGSSPNGPGRLPPGTFPDN